MVKQNDKKTRVNLRRNFERMALARTSFNINSVHKNIPREKMGVRQKLTAKLN